MRKVCILMLTAASTKISISTDRCSIGYLDSHNTTATLYRKGNICWSYFIICCSISRRDI